MTIEAKGPRKDVQYVDQKGSLTLQGMLLIGALLEEIKRLDARLTAGGL